jgi:hypothetical protein
MPGRNSFQVSSRPKNIPGRALWQPYAGKEYTVFVDESFFKFFDFTHADGNFVHGTVGVPTERYEDFTVAMRPAVDDYRRAVREATGVEPTELKSSDLYKQPFPVRRRLVLSLNAALAAHGGFVTGFYTSNRGYVMEAIRESLEDGTTTVPEEHAGLFTEKAKKLNEAESGPGKSDLLGKLLFLPVAATAYFFNDLECPFRMVYDPRDEREDVAVKNTIEKLMAMVMKTEKLGIKSTFLGLEIDKRSHEEFGLQIADIVAGEVRRYFRFNPDLLTHGSGLDLITFEIQDGEVATVEEIDGALHKKGRQVQIPTFLLKKAMKASEDCALPYLRNLLGSGLITCITEFGTERDVALFDGCFLDLCD